jgi:hypothetical protein
VKGAGGTVYLPAAYSANLFSVLETTGSPPGFASKTTSSEWARLCKVDFRLQVADSDEIARYNNSPDRFFKIVGLT